MEDEQEQQSPVEAGRPTILVYVGENNEIDVGAANYDFSFAEIGLILEIAQSKIALLEHQVGRRQRVQEEMRSAILRGV